MATAWALCVAAPKSRTQIHECSWIGQPLVCSVRKQSFQDLDQFRKASPGIALRARVLSMLSPDGQKRSNERGIVSRRTLVSAIFLLPFVLSDPSFAADKQTSTQLTAASTTAPSEDGSRQTVTSEKAGGSVTFPSQWFKSEKSDGSVLFGNSAEALMCGLVHVSLPSVPSKDPFDVAWNVLAMRGITDSVSLFVRSATEDSPPKGKGKRSWRFEFDTEITVPSGDVITRKGLSRAVLVEEPGEIVTVVLTSPKEKWDDFSRNYSYVIDSLETV